MNPIFMEVRDVVTEQASDVLFVQRNDVVQDLSPAAADPSFRDAILPGRLDARLPGLQTRCLQKGDDIAIEFRIAVEHDVTIWACFGKRLPQLLHDPLGSRMAGHVAVQNLASRMLDDEETVEQLERNRRHGEKVECHDHFAVILQKGKPTIARITAAADGSQISSDGSFRNGEAELHKLPVNPRSAPVGVLFRQATDQNSHLVADLRPAAARPGPPSPVQAKAGTVPSDDRLRLDDDEDVGRSRPQGLQSRPEEPIERV